MLSARHIVAIALVVLVQSGLPVATDPEPTALDARSDAIALISEIVSTRLQPLAANGPTWIDPDIHARINQLKTLTMQHELQLDIVSYLLEKGRNIPDRQPEYVFLATLVWLGMKERLRDEGSLFLRLLSLSHCRFESKTIFLRSVAESLSGLALSATDEQGRTAFELYLESSLEFGDLKIDLAVEIARQTPEQALDLLSVATLDRLSPHIWAQIFHEHNVKITDRLGDPDLCFDNIFGDRPDRTLLEQEVMLTKIRRMQPDTAQEEIREMFDGLDLEELLEDFKGHFKYRMNADDLNAIWRLVGLYNVEELQTPFLTQAPLLFASKIASYQVIVKFIQEIVFNGHHEDVWRLKVLMVLLEFHMKHDETVAFDLAARFNGESRYVLIHGLLNCLNPEQTVITDGMTAAQIQIKLLQDAILFCSQFREASDIQPFVSFLLSLTLRTIVERPDNPNFVKRMPDFSDEILRPALVSFSMWPDFHFVMNKIFSIHNPIFYDRIKTLIPSKSIQLVDDRPMPLIRTKRMYLRTGSELSHDYEILEKIGSGSFGSVYKGRCLRGPGTHEVAIKVMEASQPDTQREVEFMSQFCHSGQIPGLVQLLDLVQYGNDIYMVMELVQGQTVQKLTIPADETEAGQQLVSITYQILTVVHHLHQIGWNHGDIQHLNNFMFDMSDNRVVALDFGYAERPDRVKRPVACIDDLDSVFQRFTTMFDTIKLHFGMPWYEPASGELGLLCAALEKWPESTWNCASLLQDPVFDTVRANPLPSGFPSKYLDYPDMIKEQVKAELLDEWKADFTAHMKDDLREQVREDLETELTEQLRNEFQEPKMSSVPHVTQDKILLKENIVPIQEPQKTDRVHQATSDNSSQVLLIVITSCLSALLLVAIGIIVYLRFYWNPLLSKISK